VAPSGGALVMGHYAFGSKRIVPVEECPVHAARGNRIAFALRDRLAHRNRWVDPLSNIQVALLALIGLKLAQVRGTMPPAELEFILDQLYELPSKIERFLDGAHPIEEIAQRFYDKPFFLYLGRHIGLPVALEGALKLKEISYIPTDAYSAGEMKHGPIALLDEGTPVVCVATDQKVIYDKVVSNIQETRARGAHVIAIATDGNEDIQHHADDVIYVPKTPAFLQVVLAILPLQLLAYRIARLRGLNVDQPRNLAKTVTVE